MEMHEVSHVVDKHGTAAANNVRWRASPHKHDKARTSPETRTASSGTESRGTSAAESPDARWNSSLDTIDFPTTRRYTAPADFRTGGVP